MAVKYVLSVCVVVLAQTSWAQKPVLPPVPPAGADPTLSEAVEVLVQRFEFKGNTVFGDDELRQLLEPYRGRQIDTEELESARRALTLHYVNHGYISSGALLEDQPVTNGVITLTLIEGKVSHIGVEGNRRLRTSFIRRRLKRHAGPPLNIAHLQNGLLALKDNPNVKRINAELKPAAVRGSSLLDVKVAETIPWRLSFEVRNDRPPSIGGEVFEVTAGHANVTGHSDELTFRYGLVHRDDHGASISDFDDWGISYSVPVTAADTALRIYYDRNDFSVIEEPFAELGISSESQIFGLSIRHPVLKTPKREIAFGAVAERRESATFLMGQPFSFGGGSGGRSKEMVLRIFQEWIERSQSQVLALRSTVSFGLDVFDSTTSRDERDAVFVSWLGQAQYLRRLGDTQNQIVLNSLIQWASEPLLSMEQFSLGGASTVRGYRENQIVRDMGLAASVEVRVPVMTSPTGAALLQIAPFVDYGIGWNSRGTTPQPSDIASAGLGLLWHPHRKVDGRIYWGYAFRDFETRDSDLQDYGLHFKLSVSAF